MATARFVEDPMFETNLIHWRGSLNPVGDKIRSVTDRICRNARANAKADAAEAQAAANALRGKKYSKTNRAQFLQAAALAYSLNKHAKMIYAILESSADGNRGIVAAGHAAGAAIEFGGVDNVIKAGDKPVAYEARSTLRRSMS